MICVRFVFVFLLLIFLNNLLSSTVMSYQWEFLTVYALDQCVSVHWIKLNHFTNAKYLSSELVLITQLQIGMR